MNTRIFCSIGAISLTAGVLGVMNPAEAAVLFSVGDELSIAGSVDFSQGTPITIPGIPSGPTTVGTDFRFEKIGGVIANDGDFGNFGVLPTSTGAFAQFQNNGALDTDYKIRSFNIDPAAGQVTPTGSPAAAIPGNLLLTAANPTGNSLKLPGDFITLEGGFSGNNPDVRIQLDAIQFLNTSSIGANNFQTTVSADVSYFADNEAIGVGSFNATFVRNDTDTSFSGTFQVTEVPPNPQVPEPASVLGLLAVSSLAASGLVKRKKA